MYRIPNHFYATDTLGKCYEYKLKAVRGNGTGFRDIILKNITINDDTDTEVEPLWFKNRRIHIIKA